MRIDQLDKITFARLQVIEADASPRRAASLLSRPGIGLAIVCHADGAAAGVLSKSDLIRHLAHPCSEETTVSTLMSRSIVSCGPDDDVHSVWQTMTTQNLQNVPVLNAASKPVGILDFGDAMKALYEQEELQEQLLADYISGIGYR